MLSLDNYNDASRLIDGNFDGAALASPVPGECLTAVHTCCHVHVLVWQAPCGHSYMLTRAILHALKSRMMSLAMHAADPRLTDYELLLENLRDLKDGKDVQASIAHIFHAPSVVRQRTHVS